MQTRKLFALAGGLLILSFLAYNFSIKNTIHLFYSLDENKEKIDRLSSAPTEIAALKSQLSKFKNSLNQRKYDREEIFKSINSFCSEQGIKLSKFHPEQRESAKDLEIITNKIEVEGNYKSIVNLAYEIEYIQELGHLASLNFEKRKDRRKKKEILVGVIYLRHLISN